MEWFERGHDPNPWSKHVIFISLCVRVCVCVCVSICVASTASRSKRAPPGLAGAAAAAFDHELGAHMSIPKPVAPPSYIAPPPGMDTQAYYPSSDPRSMGAKLHEQED